MTQQVIKQDLNPEEGTVIYQEAIQLQFFSQKKQKQNMSIGVMAG